MSKKNNIFEYTPSVEFSIKPYKKETKQYRDRKLKAAIKKKVFNLLSVELIEDLVELKNNRILLIIRHNKKAYRLYLELRSY